MIVFPYKDVQKAELFKYNRSVRKFWQFNVPIFKLAMQNAWSVNAILNAVWILLIVWLAFKRESLCRKGFEI